MCRNRILQRRILRLRRVAKRQILFRRSAIHAERFLLYRKCDAISYKAKRAAPLVVTRKRCRFVSCSSFDSCWGRPPPFFETSGKNNWTKKNRRSG